MPSITLETPTSAIDRTSVASQEEYLDIPLSFPFPLERKAEVGSRELRPDSATFNFERNSVLPRYTYLSEFLLPNLQAELLLPK